MKKQTALAFCAGWLNGLFGTGGGMPALPALSETFADEKEAQRAVSFFLLPLSCISAAAARTSLLPGTAWLCAGAAIGGAAGTALAGKMNVRLLKGLFAAFLIASGLRAIL